MSSLPGAHGLGYHRSYNCALFSYISLHVPEQMGRQSVRSLFSWSVSKNGLTFFVLYSCPVCRYSQTLLSSHPRASSMSSPRHSQSMRKTTSVRVGRWGLFRLHTRVVRGILSIKTLPSAKSIKFAS